MQLLPSHQRALLPAWRLRGPADTPQGLQAQALAPQAAGQLPSTPGAEPGQVGQGLGPTSLTSAQEKLQSRGAQEAPRLLPEAGLAWALRPPLQDGQNWTVLGLRSLTPWPGPGLRRHPAAPSTLAATAF